MLEHSDFEHSLYLKIHPSWMATFKKLLGTEPHYYSKRLKSGRPDFGVFENCPVPKTSGFQTFHLKSRQNRLKTGYNVRFSDKTSEIRT